MMEFSVNILGTGAYVPEKILSNQDLEKLVETSDEWIRTRTGISERRIAADGEHTSDLAFNAGKKALEHAGVDAKDLGMVIVATITPDYSFPATASLVAHKWFQQRRLDDQRTRLRQTFAGTQQVLLGKLDHHPLRSFFSYLPSSFNSSMSP